MRTVLYFLFSLFVPSITLESKPKLCINCKHFKTNFGSDNDFGKCSLFTKNNDVKLNFVTGDNIYPKPELYYCSTARSDDHMCGEDGLFYEENITPTILENINKFPINPNVGTFLLSIIVFFSSFFLSFAINLFVMTITGYK